MLTGPELVDVLQACGVNHVVWIPDSELGRWDAALVAATGLQLIRVAREGEALGVAAGLLLGGQRPIVAMQCTGLFEAGDALRNVIHDLKLPLCLLVGVRSHQAHARGSSTDSCPVFIEPFLQAWRLPFRVALPELTAADVREAIERTRSTRQPFALLIPE